MCRRCEVEVVGRSGERKVAETAPAVRIASETGVAVNDASANASMNGAGEGGGGSVVGPVADAKAISNCASNSVVQELDAARAKREIALIRKEVEKRGLVVETYGGGPCETEAKTNAVQHLISFFMLN